MTSNAIRSIMIIAVFIGFSGCATMTIEGDVPKTPKSNTCTDDGYVPKTQQTKTCTQVETIHGTYYDFVWKSTVVLKCDHRRGLARVRYHTNALYALVSIVSLGLYVPQTIEWWCDGSPIDDGSSEVYHPGQ